MDKAITQFRAHKHYFSLAFVATIAALLTFMLSTTGAFADIGDSLNNWIAGIESKICNAMLSGQADILASISSGELLTNPFTKLLGTPKSGMYNLIWTVWDRGVLPIGCTILGLVFILQLIKITRHVDGSQTMPGVKEVIFLLVFFAVFLWLLKNSFEIMKDFYELSRVAIENTNNAVNTTTTLNLQDIKVTADGENAIGGMFMLLLACLLSWIVVFAIYILSTVMILARGLQIYVMSAFAPIPLSLLGADATRQIGIGYIKNYVAVCFAGLILLILLLAFPVLMNGLMTGFGIDTNLTSPDNGHILSSIGLYSGILLVYLLALIKHGSWAQQIFGS